MCIETRQCRDRATRGRRNQGRHDPCSWTSVRHIGGGRAAFGMVIRVLHPLVTMTATSEVQRGVGLEVSTRLFRQAAGSSNYPWQKDAWEYADCMRPSGL